MTLNNALLRTSHKVRRPENADVGAMKKYMTSILRYLACLLLLSPVGTIAGTTDTNLLNKLEDAECAIEVSQQMLNELTRYEQQQIESLEQQYEDFQIQKASGSFVSHGIPTSPNNIAYNLRSLLRRIEYCYEAISNNVAEYSPVISELQEKHTQILRDAGIAPGTCELHDVIMNELPVEIFYGFPSAKPDGYYEARLITFRNSDEPISGGCMYTPNDPTSRSRLVCPICVEYRNNWLTEHSETNESKPQQAGPGYPPQGVGSPDP